MGLITWCLPLVAVGQVQDSEPGDSGSSNGNAPTEQPKKPVDSGGLQPKPVTGTPSPPRAVNPKLIRVFLMDGSVIAGELSVESIGVTTHFGKLTVPVSQIISMTPGLESHTTLSGKINRLLEDLGSDDYKTREQAHKDLFAMGTPIRDVVSESIADKNAERKRHATEIVQKMDEILEEADDDDDEGLTPKLWVRHDLIVTPKFTIAGRISPSVFKVTSKYGPLNVSLNDIKTAERDTGAAQSIAKKLSVPGNSIVQRGMKSSGISVEPGDTVTVSAEGNVAMTPWGSSSVSGPEGRSNYGSYQSGGKQFFGGTLVARVGNSGQLIKVGRKVKFVVKKSGTLKFGMAMNNSYVGSNYRFPGDYKVRLRVTKK